MTFLTFRGRGTIFGFELVQYLTDKSSCTRTSERSKYVVRKRVANSKSQNFYYFIRSPNTRTSRLEFGFKISGLDALTKSCPRKLHADKNP